MPRKAINYANTVIYKIICKDEAITDIYVGRTTQANIRESTHKSSSKCNQEYVYEVIRLHGNWKNWKFVIIEKYPCNNSIEADDREQFWINTLQATLNTQIKYSDVEYKKEWYYKNQERIRIQQNKYRIQQKKTKYDKLQAQLDSYNDFKKLYHIDHDNLENNPEWFLNNVKNRKI